MHKDIYSQLKEWEKSLNLVLIEGSGEKAFCAGGDLQFAASLSKESFFEWYTIGSHVFHLISTFKIPYVALWDGIVMGSGVGLSVHAPYQVATSKTLFAMPETGIGMITDAGCSYIFPQLKGELGTFLALTGHRLKGSDW